MSHVSNPRIFSLTVVSSSHASKRYNLCSLESNMDIFMTTNVTELLADEAGNINFPSLGVLQVKELTTKIRTFN